MQLAADLGLPVSTMSHYMPRLGERSHPQSKRNPADGRPSLIELSPAGRFAAEACFTGFEKAIVAFRRYLDISERTCCPRSRP